MFTSKNNIQTGLSMCLKAYDIWHNMNKYKLTRANLIVKQLKQGELK